MSDVPTSCELEVGWYRVVKKQKVHTIEVVQLLLVKRADVVEELCCHVSCSPCAFGWGGEADLVLYPSQLQHVTGVLLQSLVFPHHIVVDEAGVAQRVNPFPVLVKWLFSLGGRVHKVIHKLLERHIVASLQSFRLRVRPVPSNYLCAVSFMESCVVATREFVAVCGHQPLEGLTYEDELQVGAQALVYLRGGVLWQSAEVSWDVGLIGWDCQWIAKGPSSTGQNHEHPLPVCAGHFGHIAVQQAMLVIHDHVFQVLRYEDSAFAGVGVTGFFQQLPTTLMDHLHCWFNLQRDGQDELVFVCNKTLTTRSLLKDFSHYSLRLQ